MSLFQRPVVPVANKDDARATTAALPQYVDTSGMVIAVTVIEKADGAPDKVSVEQGERFADEIFEIVAEGLEDIDIAFESHQLYGRNVAETIIEAAHDLNASSIVFTPRGGSRWLKLLTGDVTVQLVNESDLPIVVLPDRSDDSYSNDQ